LEGAGTREGCGGLLRDSDGRRIKGYVRKIEICDAFNAEMWGMYIFLDMAWRANITHLIVDIDSKILVDMINDNCKFNKIVPTLVRRKLFSLSWTVHINHTWRGGNRSVDWLANFSISSDSMDFYILETPPIELQRLLFDDISEICICFGTSL
jgi:ribonuclease HI